MRREEESAGYRHERVQGLIFEELRALMRDDVSDPALTNVRLVAVDLSVDYRHARVHFVVAAAEVRRGVERALIRVTPFLRVRLADAVATKRVPELRFVFDGMVLPSEGGTPCTG